MGKLFDDFQPYLLIGGALLAFITIMLIANWIGETTGWSLLVGIGVEFVVLFGFGFAYGMLLIKMPNKAEPIQNKGISTVKKSIYPKRGDESV